MTTEERPAKRRIVTDKQACEGWKEYRHGQIPNLITRPYRNPVKLLDGNWEVDEPVVTMSDVPASLPEGGEETRLAEAERRLQLISELPTIEGISHIVTAGTVMQRIAKEYFEHPAVTTTTLAPRDSDGSTTSEQVEGIGSESTTADKSVECSEAGRVKLSGVQDHADKAQLGNRLATLLAEYHQAASSESAIPPSPFDSGMSGYIRTKPPAPASTPAKPSAEPPRNDHEKHHIWCNFAYHRKIEDCPQCPDLFKTYPYQSAEEAAQLHAVHFPDNIVRSPICFPALHIPCGTGGASSIDYVRSVEAATLLPASQSSSPLRMGATGSCLTCSAMLKELCEVLNCPDDTDVVDLVRSKLADAKDNLAALEQEVQELRKECQADDRDWQQIAQALGVKESTREDIVKACRAIKSSLRELRQRASHCDMCRDPVTGSVHYELVSGKHRCCRCMKQLETQPSSNVDSGSASSSLPKESKEKNGPH